MSKIIKFFVLLIIVILLSSFYVACKNHEPEISYIGYGGQRNVSGSMHCIKIDKELYMVDAGIFYEDEEKNYTLPSKLDIKNLKAVFITHAHADHTGRLPLLLENGYTGPIYMTGVTYDLTKIMLISSLDYSDFDISEEELLQRLKKQVVIVDYDKPFYLENNISNFFNKLNIPGKYYSWCAGNKIKAEYLYSSHLPGSAMILFDINGKDILFSGDLGSESNPFLKKNNKFEGNIDYLFVEGTYGIEGDNSNNAAERTELQQLIGNKLAAGYRIIIPAFVLDRTQQILYEIKKGMEKNYIPKSTIIKVYSPTSMEITDKYRLYSSQEKAYKSFFSNQMFDDIFDIKKLSYNPKKDNGSYDTEVNYGEIAIMSSGMVSHVFSKGAVDKYIEDPKTFILIVGYQAEGTEGRELIEAHDNKDEYIFIDGEKKKINPDHIFRSYAFNSHADLSQITDIFGHTNPEKIFLVHLNPEEVNDLIEKYQKLFPGSEVIAPNFAEKYDLKS